VYSPYDWNQAVQHRSDYIDQRLRDGSPVVGLSVAEGQLLFTVRRAQRKIFDIYDRLMYGAVGSQSDVETIRLAAIDVAHQEGYARSPDDVTAQRIVGLRISPAVRRAFGDQFATPVVIRAVFAELGERREADQFFMLNYDGEFIVSQRCAVVAGTRAAEERMVELLDRALEMVTGVPQAIRLAAEAWGTGLQSLRRLDEEEDGAPGTDLTALLREEIRRGTVEIGFLERNTTRENRFRLLRADEIRSALSEYVEA
jgi:proteasome alpha subunit